MRNTINDYGENKEIKHWGNGIISWKMNEQELKKSGYEMGSNFMVHKFSNGMEELELFCDFEAPVGYQYSVFVPGKNDQEGSYGSKEEARNVILERLKLDY